MNPRRRSRRPGADAFRLLFDHHPDPLWIFHAETLRVLGANAASSAFYGVAPAEFLTLKLKDLHPGGDADRLAGPGPDPSGDLLPSRGWRIRKRDGSRVTVAISSAPLDFGGQPGRLVWIREVVSVEKPSSAVHPGSGAGEAGAALLELLAHELRSPLGTVQLWTDLLGASKDDPATVERALGMIKRGVRALEQVVDDVLDLSLIAAGRLRLDPHPLDLAALVSDAVGQARELGVEKRVDVAYIPPAAPPPLILGDRSRLLRSLGKLLASAVKRTPRDGCVRVQLDHEGSEARIVVSEGGADTRPRPSPDEGASARSPRLPEVGLSIVQTVAGLHGGRVETGGGLDGHSLSVVLPLGTPPSPASGVAADPEPPRLTGTRVLVVEDSEDAREALKIILERWGANVATAGSAAEALGGLRSFRPHVLVSDLAMPGEDGYSLIRRVRALEASEGGETPAVALTAFTTANDRRRALEAGYQRHVSKPVDPEDLLAVVAALARSHAL